MTLRPTRGWDARGELAWKWLLRLSGLGGFLYVLLTQGGNASLGLYGLIGGLIGLPSIITAQQLLNGDQDPKER